MTGIIKSLGNGGRGFIAAENGASVCFLHSALLEYDAAWLAVGQRVTFDLEDGRSRKAVNVCVQRTRQAAHTHEKPLDNTRLRYMGFQQSGNTRTYRFERVTPGEESKTYTVVTDMALFAKHHVAIQEGPALCLRLLVSELQLAGPAAEKASQCSLTEKEVVAYLASRPVPRPRRGPKRAAHAAGGL